MHDIKRIRDNPAALDAGLARRGLPPVSGDILALDEDRRALIHKAESAQAEANRAAREIGAAKAAGDDATFAKLRAEVSDKKAEIARLQDEAKARDAALHDLLLGIPNLPADDVPDGADEDDNVEIRRVARRATSTFNPLNIMRFRRPPASGFRGRRPAVGHPLRGAARRRGAAAPGAGAVHARPAHREHGLTETQTPVLVREEMMVGTGQLPKFGEDSYQTTNGWWLIPTAEVTLTNLVNGLTVEEESLPQRFVAHTQCFRSEAGSAGRDTAGMLRQHQFEKVEMVSICTPDTAAAEHDRMTGCAEKVLERLGLAFRTVILCSGDLGASMQKTHDIEVWLPGQDTYREISSVSVAGDYQARRMNARFRPRGGGKPQFVHTLNGSGLAVGRALIAVLENGQQADGSVTLPDALHPYLRGKTRISADGALV